MIYTQYKVEVEIPKEVWVNFGRKQEYDQMVLDATEGSNEAGWDGHSKVNLATGSDRYSKVYEWAIFNDEDKAIRCEEKLEKLIAYFSFKNKVVKQDI